MKEYELGKTITIEPKIPKEINLYIEANRKFYQGKMSKLKKIYYLISKLGVIEDLIWNIYHDHNVPTHYNFIRLRDKHIKEIKILVENGLQEIILQLQDYKTALEDKTEGK